MAVIPEVKSRTKEMEDMAMGHFKKEIELMFKKQKVLENLELDKFEPIEPKYPFEKENDYKEIVKQEFINELDRQIVNNKNTIKQYENARDERDYYEEVGGVRHDG